MAAKRVWLLNFDADDELARPVGYAPSAAVLSRFAPLARRIGGLVPPGDVVLDEWNGVTEPPPGDYEARAFCPTPRALRVLERAKIALPPFPSLDVLRKVNGRAFCAELGQCLPGARYVRSRDELEATLAAGSGPWVMKRAFGFAGRGRQRLRSSELDASVEPFVRTSLKAGDGLEVEPWVDRTLDAALHGFITSSGDVTLGAPTLQELDDSGAWVASLRVEPGTLTPAEEEALSGEAERTAGALVRAGYFGPFGIDAYRWNDAQGRSRFNPRSEINARYSMGWAVGMGSVRPDLEPRACVDH